MKKDIYYISDGFYMNFEVFTPDNFCENLPMIVFLHGAGERGTVIEHLARHAIPKMIENGAEIPAVVLCPQCPGNVVWGNIPFEVEKLIKFAASKYNVNRAKISLTGGSMGGFGTWDIGMTLTDIFCALAPIAGGGLSWRTPNVKNIPVHAYHGEKDEAVPLIYAKLMTEALKSCGGDAELTVLGGYGHNDGINTAYEKYGVIDWLLSKKRTDFSPVPETLSKYF